MSNEVVEVVNKGPTRQVFEAGGVRHELAPGQRCTVPRGLTLEQAAAVVEPGGRVIKAAKPSSLSRMTDGWVVPVPPPEDLGDAAKLG